MLRVFVVVGGVVAVVCVVVFVVVMLALMLSILLVLVFLNVDFLSRMLAIRGVTTLCKSASSTLKESPTVRLYKLHHYM